MSSLNPTYRPARVLADVIPHGSAARAGAIDVALVVTAAALTGLSAQVSIPWWPVPLTLQTFAVLLAGSALGAMRGSIAMLAYAAVGVAGVPWFAEQSSGWGGPTFGYIIGFIAAALVVGALSERLSTRSPRKVLAIFALGSLVVYAFGVTWLKVDLDLTALQAYQAGMKDFIPGDAIKALAAAGLLPATWAVIDRVRKG